MSSTEDIDELLYHLRELRADLACVQSDLQTAATTEINRSVVAAWSSAAALLEHDLEVHFPRALVLLGANLPPDFGPRPSQSTSDLRSSGSEALAATARDAGQMIALAIAALPLDSEPPSSTTGLLEAARISTAVHNLVAGRSEQALEEELVQELRKLHTALSSTQAGLETLIHINPLWAPTWEMIRTLLDRALNTHFLRAFQILGMDPAEPKPLSAMNPPEVPSADVLVAAAQEASKLVATALANLPSVVTPASCETELREAAGATSVAHHIIANAHELLIQLHHVLVRRERDGAG